MDDTFTITLIRHFPTNGNREKKYIGWTDESIISAIQTKKLDWELTQVIGSDLIRCKQTAEQLFQGIPYLVNANFRECSFGDWEEKTYNELKEDTIYKRWLENPGQVAPPNGESLESMEKRVLQGFYNVVKEFEEPVILTHGGPIRILLTKFASADKSFWEWEVPHGCCYELQWATKKDILEGKPCMSFSVEHLMVNEHM